jgi:hypothetical protein
MLSELMNIKRMNKHGESQKVDIMLLNPDSNIFNTKYQKHLLTCNKAL